MNGKTIVILGGGIGGVVVASQLRKQLRREHRVILVEREVNHLFQPSLLWLMTGARTAEAIQRPVARLARRGIELVHGEIEAIDPKLRSVRVAGREIQGDYLVVALGAEYAPETIPGLAEAGHNFYTLAGAQSLRDARANLRHGHLVVLVSGIPFKCPAAPYESAMLLEADLRARRPRPCRRGRIHARTRSHAYRGSRGIGAAATDGDVEEHPASYRTCRGQGGSAARLLHFANGATAGFDLLAYIPPHRAPAVVRASGLTGESGWVPVDRNTLETKFPGVYAVGDVTGIPLAIGKPLPKAGVSRTPKPRWWRTTLPAPSAAPERHTATTATVNASSRSATGARASAAATSTPNRPHGYDSDRRRGCCTSARCCMKNTGCIAGSDPKGNAL